MTDDHDISPASSQDQGANKHGFVNPLPGNDAEWQETDLGPATGWPATLQSFSKTISAFAYPAAIFWSEQFALLPNQAWTELSNITGSGQKQRGKLSADVYQALRQAAVSGQPRQIRGSQLLRQDVTALETYTVLLSPLIESNKCLGVLAQIIADQSKRGGNSSYDSEHEKHAAASSHQPTAVDDPTSSIPLDEHPFFHRFAEMLPTGLAILDHQANAIFVNQHFYELTTHSEDDKSFLSWPQSIHEEDYDRVMTAFQESVRGQTELRTEFRSSGGDSPWRLLLLTPLGDENLQHVSLRDYGGFICSIVDISSEKSAELNERKAAKEAKERKEQQERFIDMISHEIRNPLSAILHCTEDIDLAIKPKNEKIDTEGIREAIDTINLCISHQKNIVDDVLSFSKLDASMLSLAPKPSQPSRQMGDFLKIFQPELRKQDVRFDYCLDPSYVECAVSWTMADMARIGQILVNLTTNAIKFTARKEGEKKVTVSVGASRERPTSYPPSVVFFNADDLAFRLDSTHSTEWGNGETLFIMVAVKDTGIGINRENQQRLFERFRQATPKTEEVYGGSGLGLNISRKLCHLHGGEIGVASEEGKGSTFGFFFKVRRADSPEKGAGSKEREADQKEDVKDQVESYGLESPSELEQANAPRSLNNPPVNHEQPTLQPSKGDDRYQETADVAAHVQDAKSDPYGNAERPKISQTHRSGEFWQSKDIKESKSTSKESNQQSGDQSPQSAGSQSMDGVPRKAHILLAEDNVVNQRIVFRKLEKQGYSVTTANNGQEAVAAIREAPKLSSGHKAAFDIILMDQEMPVKDGNAATKEIRKLEEEGTLERTPILGVTANVRDDQQNDMVANGMDDVISKPYKIDELVKMVEKLLQAEKNAPVEGNSE